jgi:Delta3-Delta2-enoyl-CoA isomerase
VGAIRVERTETLAVLRLDKARGNAIDEALVEELTAVTRELAADDGVRGVLLASAHPKVFCPGLDLVGLWEYDRAAMERFLGRFARCVWALYGLRKPVVAALSGHSVAGGCVLALTADLRVLRRGVQIGLNEVKIGVPLPWSVALLLRASVSPGALARVALLGRNFADEEAVEVGLADVLAEPEGFEAACLARLHEFAEKDPRAFGATKAYLRSDVLGRMVGGEEAHAGEFLDAWFSPETRDRIRRTVESRKAKA